MLFDIDGTLLLGGWEAHRAAMCEALEDVYGLHPVAAPVAATGWTDRQFARAALRAAGAPDAAVDRGLHQFEAVAAERFGALCPPDLTSVVAPGIREWLDDAAGRQNVLISLVTGNLEPIARLKLARAGIGHYFPAGQGAFGSDAEDRGALPAIARRRAACGPEAHPCDRTVLIGDTPRDVACARADGIRCVAVSTGAFSARELSAADVVVADAAAARHSLWEVLGLPVRAD